jgi:hypothetical protein
MMAKLPTVRDYLLLADPEATHGYHLFNPSNGEWVGVMSIRIHTEWPLATETRIPIRFATYSCTGSMEFLLPAGSTIKMMADYMEQVVIPGLRADAGT